GAVVQRTPGRVGDDDLAVDHAALRQASLDRRNDLGEVARHRPLVPAADLDLLAVAEDDRPKAVPLGLEAQLAIRDGLDRLGQHRRDRRHHRQIHPPIFAYAARPRAATPSGWARAAGLGGVGCAGGPAATAPACAQGCWPGWRGLWRVSAVTVPGQRALA